MRPRVSRLTAVNGDLDLGDTTSEQPFITQPNPSSIHNIDSCRFGPDGYFYWAAGDAGGLNDGNNNAQRIDKDFWGGIFRIDVDRLPGIPEPNAHASIVLNGGTAYYKVPADNPFIAATTFNGLALTGTLRTELFAIGMRNPWQFSFDPQNGEMWAGEVGLDSWEEVNIVTPGGNFGWSYLEGTAPGTRTDPPVGFAPIAPLWTSFHGGGVLEGRSVTGGLLYRGSKYPALTGSCTSLATSSAVTSGPSHARRLEPTHGGTHPLAKQASSPSCSTPIPRIGDILISTTATAKCAASSRRRSIRPSPPNSATPASSPTSVISASIQVSSATTSTCPSRSDYAIKSRWFMLPNDTDTFGYVQEGNSEPPRRCPLHQTLRLRVHARQSGYEEAARNPPVIINATGSYGVSYRWS